MKHIFKHIINAIMLRYLFVKLTIQTYKSIKKYKQEV